MDLRKAPMLPSAPTRAQRLSPSRDPLTPLDSFHMDVEFCVLSRYRTGPVTYPSMILNTCPKPKKPRAPSHRFEPEPPLIQNVYKIQIHLPSHPRHQKARDAFAPYENPLLQGVLHPRPRGAATGTSPVVEGHIFRWAWEQSSS